MFRINRRFIQNLDWWLIATVLIISVIGVITIYSATRQPAEATRANFYIKQMLWLSISICGLFLFTIFDYNWLNRLSVTVYITGLLLLLVVFVLGRAGMGAQRWISVGPVSFQPSEFFKIIFIIMLSGYFTSRTGVLGTFSLIKAFFVIVFIPFVFLYKQPDLGTALIILTIFICLALTKGLHKKTLILVVVISLVSLPFIGNIVWTGLKDYQKNRLIAFIEPEADPSGIGYHINQSKIAIGSGKFFGKGFLKGTQGPFRFLPEKHTDFIFSVFAEEWGFLGSSVLLFLYLFLIIRGLDTAKKAKDDFGKMLSLGITYMFAIYFFINIGMTLGIMPVVGIPLPFMSYGGTALLSNFIAVGILINIRTRRFALFY